MSKKVTYEIDFQGRDSVSSVVSKIVSEITSMGGSSASALRLIATELTSQADAISDFGKRNVSTFKQMEDGASGAMSGTASAYASALDRIRADLAGGTADLQSQIAQQKKIVAELEKQYAELAAKRDSAPTGGMKNNYSKQADSLFAELEAERQALDALKQAQEEVRLSSATVSRQIEKLRNDMAQLRLENKEDTEEYEAMRAKMEELATAYREAGAEQKALSTGATQIGGVMNGMQGLMGLYSAGSGIISMFVDDNERLMEVQTKMQSVMAIMMGLQQVSNTLHATSAFRIVTVRTVTDLWRAANNRLTVSLGMSTAAANAFLATVTFGASVVITAAVTAISALIRKNREQKEAQEAEAKAVAENQQNIRNSVSNSISAQLVSYRKLQSEWKSLQGNLTKQNKFIEDNQKEFKDLGVSVDDVRDAENLLINNEAAFIQSIKNKAMAAAAMELAVQKYKGAVEQMMLAEEARKATDADKMLASQAGTAAVRQSMEGASSMQSLNMAMDPANQQRTYQQAYDNYLSAVTTGRATEYENAAQAEIKAGDAYFDVVQQYQRKAVEVLSGVGISTGGTSTSGGGTGEVPIAGSIAEIEQKLEELRNKLKNASAEERATIQGDINVWQEKLDVISAELEALNLPVSVDSLSELQTVISYYERQLQTAGESERAQIQQTINAYKRKRESIEDSLKSVGISADPKTLDELNASLSYYQDMLGKAAPEDRAGIQETINGLQTEIDLIESTLSALSVPVNPVSLQDYERCIEALETKLQTAGETERAEIQRAINAYRVKKQAIEDSLSMVEVSDMFPDIDVNSDIIISLQTRLVGADIAKQKIQELQAMSAVAQTEEEKEAIDQAIKSWSKYTGTMTTAATKGEAAGQIISSIGSVMGQMSGAVEGNAADWLSWGANVLSSIAALIPQLVTLCTANTAVAATGAAASCASIPVVGWVMAGAAALGLVATLASIPKFAEGGIISGPTLGLMGEYSGATNNPEVVAPLNKLKGMLDTGGDDGGPAEVIFRIEGRTLAGVLEKYNRKRNRT